MTNYLAALLAAAAVAAPLLKGAAMAQDTRTPDTLALGSGALTLEFRKAGEGAVLASLADASGRQWLQEGGEGCTLWKIAFQGPDGQSTETSGAQAVLCSMRRNGDSAELVWNAPVGGAEAVVRVFVRLPKGSALSYWTVEADLPDGWSIARADFPFLPNLPLKPGLKLAAPAGWGLEYELKPGVGYQAAYPSCIAAMPFAAFYSDGSGLYIGAHDATGSHKTLSGGAEETAARFALTWWTPIPEQGGGKQSLPGEAVVGVFEGDWYDAAQIYRDFSFSTPWGSAGPLSKRDTPDWLKETELWLRPPGDPMENVDVCVRARDYFRVPIAIHWYNWHQIPFDTLYPEYFPAKDRFADGVRALQNEGFHVMPYINGRLCDPESDTWKSGGSAWAARKEDGEPYTEIYGSKVPLNAMCPSTEGWRNTVNRLVDRLLGECGVDGVYIDQIGAAHPVRCFAEGHPHDPGGGSFWVEGYRKLLDDARAKLPKGRMLTTEENAECWIDQLDALLVVNTPTSEHRIIPLFPAVYSGRAITFGFQYIPANEDMGSGAFAAKMARGFLWGAQLGWVRPEVLMTPGSAKGAELLRALAHCRRHAHQFLQYGRFVGEVHVSGDNPRIREDAPGSFGGTYPLDVPSVMATAWQSEDGALGVAVANISDSDREVKLALPLASAGMSPADALEMETFGPEGRLSSARDVPVQQRLTVPASSALVLSVRKRT